MRILIVDDEPLARVRLRALLEEVGGYPIVGEAANGREALAMIEQSDVEIVLLDIRMPGMNGLEVARHLTELETPPAIIFVTAYGEHALEAFDANAVDYLLKPVRLERLAGALERARRPTRAQMVSLTESIPAGARQQISTRIGDRIERIDVTDIVALVAEQKYVTIHYTGGQSLTEESLRSLEAEFSPMFLRIHRNALIAESRLRSVQKGRDGVVRVEVEGLDQLLEVSRRHVAGIRRYLRG